MPSDTPPSDLPPDEPQPTMPPSRPPSPAPTPHAGSNPLTPSDPTSKFNPTPGSKPTPGSTRVLRAIKDDHPEQIGPYKIITPLGEGGMGIVYRAEQVEPVRRTVALKLVKLGMDTREVVRRFEAERQTLSVMEHPAIAKVLDAGASETGRPYFVMEYVAGEPITQYCDRHNLPTAERLRLFAIVCDAISHAHSKGVIHRDIKPSNVLVTTIDDKPAPKVIDFGIAKAINAGQLQQTVFTEAGVLVGTPEYMAPEQADPTSVDIDVRADIYSLGVLLYELLTGSPPFDPRTLRSAAYGEMQRIIREVDPPKPSAKLSSLGKSGSDVAVKRRTSVQSLTRELQRELEWIPLKAMRKDRSERYRTAAELADDVRNYLLGKPLRAGPESLAYQLRKFVRRNRTRVTAAAVSTALIFATAVTAFVLITQSRNAAIAARNDAIAAQLAEKEQREIAEKNFALAAEAIDRFFRRVGEEKLLQQQGFAQLRNDLLGVGVDYARKLLQANPDRTDIHYGIGQGLKLIGLGQKESGDFANAEKSLTDALATRRANAAGQPNQAAVAVDIATTQMNLALVQIQLQKFDEARRNLTEAVAALRPFADDPANTAADELATALNNLAELELATGRLDAGLAAHAEARTIRARLVEAEPGNDQRLAELAQTVGNIALVEQYQGDLNAAARDFEAAIELRRRAAAIAPQSTEHLANLADTAAALSLVYSDLDRPDDAAKLREEAIAVYTKVSTDPAHRQINPTLARAAGTLSYMLLYDRKFADAADAARTGLDADPTQLWIAANRAHALLLAGDVDRAMAIYSSNKGKLADLTTPFEQMVIDDIASLRNAGIDSPAFEAVIERMKQQP